MREEGDHTPQREDDPRIWSRYLAVSILCHVALVAALLFTPEFAVRKIRRPSAITVDLVALDPGAVSAKRAPGGTSTDVAAPAASPPKNQVKPAEIVQVKRKEPVLKKKKALLKKPDKKVLIEPAPEVAVSPVPAKKKVKRSLKKETYKSEKVLAGARRKLAEKVEADPMAKVFDRLKSRVAKGREQGPPGVPGSAKAPGEGGGAGIPAPEMEVYKRIIADNIQKNWAYSESLTRGRRNLLVELAIRIKRSGEIRDIKVHTRSGNHYLDESAYRAVQKSNPLPALPKVYPKSHYDIVLAFNPSGLM